MASKPETTSIPPDTGEIDTDWSEVSSVLDADGSGVPTAIPPEPYERYARQVTSQVTSAEARKALSAPRLPALDVSVLDELLEQCGHDSGEMQAMGLVGQQPSGPYAIPLELGDDGERIRASEHPTIPQLEPPPDSGVGSTESRPTPKAPVPQEGEWGAESPTPLKAFPDILRAFRHASTPGRPAIRSGVPVQEPEPEPDAATRAERDAPDAESDVTVTVGEEEYLELDEPGGINMEDSLEMSLDNVPPLPFDFPPSPTLELDPKPPPKPEPLDSLELSLEGSGDALDLVSARATPFTLDPGDPLIDLRDRYAVGDFTGANEIAESILAEQPNNAEALRFRESCRDVLSQMYTARLGPSSGIPRLAIPAAELQWLSLDHRTGFLLSCVDGRSTIEEILDVSGMPALDALRILYTLLQQQIIHIAER
jgi:hypothetical protein